MINPKLRCAVTHKADQHLSRAAEMIPVMGDERFIEFTSMLGSLISYCAEESNNGISTRHTSTTISVNSTRRKATTT